MRLAVQTSTQLPRCRRFDALLSPLLSTLYRGHTTCNFSFVICVKPMWYVLYPLDLSILDLL